MVIFHSYVKLPEGTGKPYIFGKNPWVSGEDKIPTKPPSLDVARIWQGDVASDPHGCSLVSWAW
jgi:hypothetical protein